MSKIVSESPLAFIILKTNYLFLPKEILVSTNKKKEREEKWGRKESDPGCPNRHVQPLLIYV